MPRHLDRVRTPLLAICLALATATPALAADIAAEDGSGPGTPASDPTAAPVVAVRPPAAPAPRASAVSRSQDRTLRAATPVPTPVPTKAPAPAAAYGSATVVTASWYGPGFYGNGTACGQVYSSTIQGVAHKTLPCGTAVTLRYGGTTVTVPVIDRGPYVAGREFDLSAATRAALGCPDLCRLEWLR